RASSPAARGSARNPNDHDRGGTECGQCGDAHQSHPNPNSIEKAAKDGTKDRCDLSRHGASRDEPWNPLVRTHCWWHRTDRRRDKRLTDAECNDEQEDRGGGKSVRVARV